MKAETKTNNRLWQARRRAGLAQKQVARLLGHQSCDQISRYERGARMPGLRIALKLELIYGIPISHLFPEQYQVYQAEIAAVTDHRHLPSSMSERGERPMDAHVCTYENAVLKKKPNAADIEAGNKHSIRLIQRIAEVIHRRRTF